MTVYARDYYCDELYGETDNWCATNYECELENGTINLENLIKAMIAEGWLYDDDDVYNCHIEERDDKYYVVFDDGEELFYVRREETT